jgi:hypothetical protein
VRERQYCGVRDADVPHGRIRNQQWALYDQVADLSNGVTSGINASRRLDAAFAIANPNPNPASPVLQPDGQ